MAQKTKFNEAPQWEQIANPLTLPKTARKLLELYEMRATENGGDTKYYDKRAAKYLKVSTRHVINLKKILIKNNLIVTHKSLVFNDKGEPRTLQVIRCWRIVYQQRFKINMTPNWKTDPRPATTLQNFDHIPVQWKIGQAVRIHGQTVEPAFEDSLDFALKFKVGMLGLAGRRGELIFKRGDRGNDKEALDVLGYDEGYRCSRSKVERKCPCFLNNPLEGEFDYETEPYVQENEENTDGMIDLDSLSPENKRMYECLVRIGAL